MWQGKQSQPKSLSSSVLAAEDPTENSQQPNPIAIGETHRTKKNKIKK